MFQSSFELTGYITNPGAEDDYTGHVSKLFRAYRLYNADADGDHIASLLFQSSFELTGYITYALWKVHEY